MFLSITKNYVVVREGQTGGIYRIDNFTNGELLQERAAILAALDGEEEGARKYKLEMVKTINTILEERERYEDNSEA